MPRRDRLEESLIYTTVWTFFTNSISYISIFSVFLFIIGRCTSEPNISSCILIAIALLIHLGLSSTRKSSLVVLGNFVFLTAAIFSLTTNPNLSKAFLIHESSAIALYAALNTIYQIIHNTSLFKGRGIAFILMQLVKILCVIFNFGLLQQYGYNETMNLHLFSYNFYISPLILYQTANIASLITTFTAAIVQLFTFNSELLRLSKELKKACSWSIDEQIIEKEVLNGKIHIKEEVRTILFGDIRGFTPFTERNSFEIVTQVLNMFYRTVEDCVIKSNGFKPEFIADEFVTFFTNTQSAVDCAFDLQKSLGKKLKSYGLSVGMGVHKGPVLEGFLGGPSSKKYSIIGSPANIAARLQVNADGGQVLCSAEVLGDVFNNVKSTKIKGIKLKGVDSRFLIYEIKNKGTRKKVISDLEIPPLFKKIFNTSQNFVTSILRI